MHYAQLFFRPFLAFLICGLLNTGCAYHFSSQDRRIPGGYDRIAVPMFKNRTFETGIEPFFTTAMLEELQRDNFSKVTNKDQAQVVLEGDITDVHYDRGAALSDTELKDRNAYLVTDYRINVTVAIRLIRSSDQKLLWSGNFTQERQYPAPQITTSGLDSSNANYNHSARMQNMRILARDIMSEAYSNLTENF